MRCQCPLCSLRTWCVAWERYGLSDVATVPKGASLCEWSLVLFVLINCSKNLHIYELPQLLLFMITLMTISQNEVSLVHLIQFLYWLDQPKLHLISHTVRVGTQCLMKNFLWPWKRNVLYVVWKVCSLNEMLAVSFDLQSKLRCFTAIHNSVAFWDIKMSNWQINRVLCTCDEYYEFTYTLTTCCFCLLYCRELSVFYHRAIFKMIGVI